MVETPKTDHDHDHDHTHIHKYEGGYAGGGHATGCQCPVCIRYTHGAGCECKICGGSSMEGLEGMLAGMMSKQGIDPGLLALLKDDRHHDGHGHNWIWIILLFLFFMRGGRGGFGCGDDCGNGDGYGGRHWEHRHTDDLIVNETNYSKILEAVGGNRSAIEGLAKQLCCDVRDIERCCCETKELIASTGGRILNEMQECCCDIQKEILTSRFESEKGFCAVERAIDKCCCETNRHIDKVDCDIKTGNLETRFLIESKFCATDAKIDKCCCETQALINQKFCDQNIYLERKFCDIEKREDAREIASLRAELAKREAHERDEFLIRAIREERREDSERARWERCHCTCKPREEGGGRRRRDDDDREKKE